MQIPLFLISWSISGGLMVLMTSDDLENYGLPRKIAIIILGGPIIWVVCFSCCVKMALHKLYN